MKWVGMDQYRRIGWVCHDEDISMMNDVHIACSEEF
jgi:hypothetical protein